MNEHIVTFWLDRDTVRQLADIKRRHGISRSWMIRQALARYLAEEFPLDSERTEKEPTHDHRAA